MSVNLGVEYPTLLTIEIGLATGVSTSEWDTALWDTATWSTDIVWYDISEYVRSLNVFTGRYRETDRYGGSGSMTCDNRDARFTPANTTGPYTVGGVSQIIAQIPVRGSAITGGVRYPLFYMFADSIQDEFPSSGRDAVTVFSLSHTLSALSTYDGVAASLQGDGETSGRRIQRIAANAQWPLGTSVQDGTVTCQPTDLSANAVDEILLTADSEGGVVWPDFDGSLVFEDRLSLLESPRSATAQVTFGGVGGIIFRDPQIITSSDQLCNIVAFSRVGGVVQELSDAESIARFKPKRITRSDLISETDAQVYGVAELTLAKRKTPEYRVAKVTVDGAHPRQPSDIWTQLLARRIRDRVSIEGEVLVSGQTISHGAFIEGVGHSIGPQQWSMTFTFSSSTVFDGFVTSIWDTGVWDTATWFY